MTNLPQGIYDINVQLAGLPLLPWSYPPMSYDTLASDIMNSPVIVLKEVEKVSDVIEILRGTHYQGFPVIGSEEVTKSSENPLPSFGSLRGFILRSQLMILLKEKAFSCSPEGGSYRPCVSLGTFRKYYPRHPDLDVSLNQF